MNFLGDFLTASAILLYNERVMEETDALGVMCSDIREIARELGFGKMEFPNNTNPSMVMEVHDGVIKQIDIVLHGDNDIDKTKRYRADMGC